jgi:hypothetical protein
MYLINYIKELRKKANKMKTIIYKIKYWTNIRKLKDRILWEFSNKELEDIFKYDPLDVL